MASSKKKTTKAATPKKRRGSAPRMGRAPAPTQLEVKGAERPRVPILERLLTVDVKDVVKSKATSKKPKRRKDAAPTPAAMPN